MSNPEEYTVGWICALSTEYTAAQCFLDERHEAPEPIASADNNAYTVGMIGKHKVVIAVLPDGEYGISSAANVARDMLHSFPNIKVGLMVGIGGGAPSLKNDIRLGDVVVSATRGGNASVFQYDFGKVKQNMEFQPTKLLNQPPISLRTALSALRSEYEIDGHQLEESVNKILKKKPRLQRKYQRPGPDSDRLYRSDFVHVSGSDGDKNCVITCGDDRSNLIIRDERPEDQDQTVIHYGMIASSNQLMKDALVRDRYAEKDVLCFEMEAAGLVNHFPCLVIRGICDYADSHKNKEWQGYAAMVAAAYAKDLLRQVPLQKLNAEKRICDLLSGLQSAIDDQRDIAHKQLELQEETARNRLSANQEKCLQLFRLGTGETYEWYKDSVGQRVEGTCEWLTTNKVFQRWLEEQYCPGTLLVSADPGCGKSVLARYLIDDILPQHSSTIGYFFFKDHDQDTVNQALCAILHQIFSLKMFLIEHALGEFSKNGENLIKATVALWSIFEKVVQDPRAGSVTIVLDGLDECAESDFESLMKNLNSQTNTAQSTNKSVKFFLTSRPYEQVIDKFRGLMSTLPQIHIAGEKHSERLSQEVNQVIQFRINELAMEKGLSDPIKDCIAKKMLGTGVTHRTYLWVHLMFEHLRTESFKKTTKNVELMVNALPENVSEAYERILNKSKGHPMVKRALSIILAAKRPLTLAEMNIALNVHGAKSFSGFDLEDQESFRSRLRTWCGLFVAVFHDRVFFLHQTAREFLLARAPTPTTLPLERSWRQSITSRDAHKVLAEICVLYLDLLNQEIHPIITCGETGSYPGVYAFIDYAAENWGEHHLEADFNSDAEVMSPTLDICSPCSRSCSVWYSIFYNSKLKALFNSKLKTRSAALFIPENPTALEIASCFGLRGVVTKLLESSAGELSKDAIGFTALSWAVKNQHTDVVRLFLRKDVGFELEDAQGWKLLSLAIGLDNESIVQLLLEAGTQFDLELNWEDISQSLKDNPSEPEPWDTTSLFDRNVHLHPFWSGDIDDTRPIFWAIHRRLDAILELLLKRGADLELKNSSGLTPLLSAIVGKSISLPSRQSGEKTEPARGLGIESLFAPSETVVNLLLEGGADFNSGDKWSRTPLLLASEEEESEITVRLLIKKGADLDLKDAWGQTPLSRASEKGHQNIVKLLLEGRTGIYAKARDGQSLIARAIGNVYDAIMEAFPRGANVESRDFTNQTPLSKAAESGHEAVVILLLKKGADVESKDIWDRTPLIRAVKASNKSVSERLLEAGADPNAKNRWGQTALLWAVRNGDDGMVQLLLDQGADFNVEDNNGRTPLSRASECGYKAIVRLLLLKGAIIESRDKWDQTPLSRATGNGHTAIIELLVVFGADIESKDIWDRAPLIRAVKASNKSVSERLLEAGADPNAKNRWGQTALLWAVRNGDDDMVQLLLDQGADFNVKDNNGRTPLSRASECGYEAIVRLLLLKGAIIESRDRWGQTALSRAAGNGHTAIVELLVAMGATSVEPDLWGRTALSWATINGHESIKKLLLAESARCETKETDN